MEEEGHVECFEEFKLECEMPEISLHAIAGALNLRTIRTIGCMQGCYVVLLVDIDGTHNFLEPMIAKKASMKIDTTE